MRYAKIPDRFDIKCVICHDRADYCLKFTRRDVGDIHSYFCKRCFTRFKNDFRKDNLKEIKPVDDTELNG